jgi:hypothetical protein
MTEVLPLFENNLREDADLSPRTTFEGLRENLIYQQGVVRRMNERLRWARGALTQDFLDAGVLPGWLPDPIASDDALMAYSRNPAASREARLAPFQQKMIEIFQQQSSGVVPKARFYAKPPEVYDPFARVNADYRFIYVSVYPSGTGSNGVMTRILMSQEAYAAAYRNVWAELVRSKVSYASWEYHWYGLFDYPENVLPSWAVVPNGVPLWSLQCPVSHVPAFLGPSYWVYFPAGYPLKRDTLLPRVSSRVLLSPNGTHVFSLPRKQFQPVFAESSLQVLGWELDGRRHFKRAKQLVIPDDLPPLVSPRKLDLVATVRNGPRSPLWFLAARPRVGSFVAVDRFNWIVRQRDRAYFAPLWLRVLPQTPGCLPVLPAYRHSDVVQLVLFPDFSAPVAPVEVAAPPLVDPIEPVADPALALPVEYDLLSGRRLFPAHPTFPGINYAYKKPFYLLPTANSRLLQANAFFGTFVPPSIMGRVLPFPAGYNFNPKMDAILRFQIEDEMRYLTLLKLKRVTRVFRLLGLPYRDWTLDSLIEDKAQQQAKEIAAEEARLARMYIRPPTHPWVLVRGLGVFYWAETPVHIKPRNLDLETERIILQTPQDLDGFNYRWMDYDMDEKKQG